MKETKYELWMFEEDGYPVMIAVGNSKSSLKRQARERRKKYEGLELQIIETGSSFIVWKVGSR